MSVGKICSRIVDTAGAEERVADVAARMTEANVGSLPVLDEEGRLVGIVTDRDLVLRVVAQRRDGQQTRVAEVMSECPQTVREDASLEVALAAMRKRSTRRLPVVDAHGKLVGMLTLDDLLSLLAEEFSVIGKVIDAEGPRKPGRCAIPDEPPGWLAPSARVRREAGAADAPRIPASLERTLAGIRDSLEVIACAASIGLPIRLLGGGVIEAEVRAAADRRLREILAREGTPQPSA